MQLTAIELKGFKSFAGHFRLDFSSGITAIIGPNGSGKSNLAEAVRWVLGEQSSKQLRGRERTDVIFSGTDNSRRSFKASVSLTFNNESGRFPVEAAEINISRTINRAGESEYAINGDPVRLIDLQKMLAEAGIGAKSYTVISQGTVDRYLTATPTERQELFDEATGIRSLQIKLKEAESKLKAAEHHADEINMVLAELEPRLRVLRRQVQQHEEKNKLARQLETEKKSWYHHAWHVAMKNLNDCEALEESSKQRISLTRTARQRAEQAHWQTLKQNSPSTLESEYQQEKDRYETAYLLYQQTKQAKLRLEKEIISLTGEYNQAKIDLREKKDTSLHFDWLKQARLLLRRCAAIMTALSSGQRPTGDIKELAAKIDSLLDRIQDDNSLDLARSVVSQLEKPLQEVARLEAILQERQSQLKQIKIISAPDKKRLDELEQALNQQEKKQPSEPRTAVGLEEARAAEINAERESVAACAAVEQAKRDVYELEQDILRECGSQWLQLCQSSPPTSEIPNKETIDQLSAKISAIGTIDPLALKEYDEVSSREARLRQQLLDINKTQANLETLRRQLVQDIKRNFEQRFALINQIFSQYFVRLFEGGRAQLRIEQDGINIIAEPPGKKPRYIGLLSGGEKALASIALLLAITEASSPPFIVMDEVDAALDEANSRRLAHILSDISRKTQCIVITHNRQTMGQAQVLYGVTMPGKGQSTIYSVSFKDIAAMASPATLEAADVAV